VANESSAGGGAPAEVGSDAVLGNASTLLQSKPQSDKRITSLAAHPSRPGTWLLSVDGSPAFAVRETQIRSARRVRNVATHSGLSIDMPTQAEWSAMLVAARDGGGA
jgi:hypothetical protein